MRGDGEVMRCDAIGGEERRGQAKQCAFENVDPDQQGVRLGAKIYCWSIEASAFVQAIFFLVISLLGFITTLACIGRRQKACFISREQMTMARVS
jgi:hypothetical protein